MPTEDDTFRILSRPGFEEMKLIHQSWWYSNPSKDKRQRIPFMIKHKRTWLEFVLEAKKREVGLDI
jgi:hypothetical protein